MYRQSVAPLVKGSKNRFKNINSGVTHGLQTHNTQTKDSFQGGLKMKPISPIDTGNDWNNSFSCLDMEDLPDLVTENRKDFPAQTSTDAVDLPDKKKKLVRISDTRGDAWRNKLDEQEPASTNQKKKKRLQVTFQDEKDELDNQEQMSKHAVDLQDELKEKLVRANENNKALKSKLDEQEQTFTNKNKVLEKRLQTQAQTFREEINELKDKLEKQTSTHAADLKQLEKLVSSKEQMETQLIRDLEKKLETQEQTNENKMDKLVQGMKKQVDQLEIERKKDLFDHDRPQAVRVGNNISSSITLSTGAPQGCVLSPLLFTLLTHDCTTTHSTNHMVKFTDDTTLVDLITKNSPTPILNTFYRGTIESILTSCITVWGSSCTEHSMKALQRIVNTAGKIIGAPLPLPSLKDTYATRLIRKATSIASDTTQSLQPPTLWKKV
ncbi:uncharacterized protein LOC119220588 [Pungitius pungitius]|uniref:uncharacterized protein LOC119220588 n=1 Tax=Pungitius pungitius TaxID=134920 RepID=UPI002E164696